MSYCPVCKHQFEDGVKECPDDKELLVEELPYQTVEGDGTAWVEIASVVTMSEARILQGFLDGAGIPTQVESLKFTAEPVNLGAMAEIRVFVDASKEEEALRLIEDRGNEFALLVADESVMTDEGPAVIEDDSETASDEGDTTPQ